MDFLDILTNFGFPVCCVIALAYFLYQQYNKLFEQNKLREERYISLLNESQTQMKQLSETNASFVSVINSMQESLDDIKEDLSSIKVDLNK